MAIDGRGLKICRILQGVTLTRLAAELGVSPQYLNQIEANKRKASSTLAQRYFEALGNDRVKAG